MISTVTLRAPNQSARQMPFFSLLALVCLFGLGCDGPSASLRPLYTRAEANALPQNDLLKGKWVLATEDSLHSETREGSKPDDDYPDSAADISASSEAGTGAYKVELRANQPGQEFGYHHFALSLVVMGGHTFFDAVSVEEPDTRERSRTESVRIAPDVHWFGAARIEPDFLRFSFPKDSIFSAYIPSPSPDPDSDASPLYQGIFTGSTMQLREALANSWNNPDLVQMNLYFCRPQMDCNLAVVEDQLKDHPLDPNILDNAADLFLARGDYPRATELLRKAVAIPAETGYYHSQLGLALALAGNYSQARQEFASAASTHTRPDNNCTERSLTHFLEGSFSEVVQTAGACAAGQHPASADPILLKYFSLLRLAKQKEAEKYLTQVTQSFNGEEKEHLLLLEIQGRLQGHNIALESPAIQRRFEFFHGLQAEAAGKDARAAAIFEEAIFARKDSLLALAGRNELAAIRKRLLDPKPVTGVIH